MAGNVIEKPIGQIQKLRPYLPEKSREELEKILAYGEKIKAEGERKKKEFWSKYDRNDFMKLLKYKWKHKEDIERLLGYDDNVGENADGKENFLSNIVGLFDDKFIYLGKKYKYVGNFGGLEKKKFIEEYLYDDILYSGELDETEDWMENYQYDYYYDNWKKERVVIKIGTRLDFSRVGFGPQGAKAIAENLKLKEGVKLNLSSNQIGDEGVEAISKMKLKEGVTLGLNKNNIGSEGAKAIAENLKLNEGVFLNLGYNEIGDEGVKAIAENMELKECVELSGNQIGLEGAEAISKMKLKEGVWLDLSAKGIGDIGTKAMKENMELKEGVWLDLQSNNISKEMKDELKQWVQGYKNKGINCNVLF